MPAIGLGPEAAGSHLNLWHENPLEFAKLNGYCINGQWVTFVAHLGEPGEKLYVAGEFNGWQKAIGQNAWEMEPDRDREFAILTVKTDLLQGARFFKFVNEKGFWHEPSYQSTNIGYEGGARNHTIDYNRTGAHVLRFEVAGGADWLTMNRLVWSEPGHEEEIPLWPGRNFYKLHSDEPQGALLEGRNTTRFRLFAPRASQVAVTYYWPGQTQTRVELKRENEVSWSATVPQNLEGYSYFYTIDGPHWPHTLFDPTQKILDPWALAVRDGVGVVVDAKPLYKSEKKKFKTPAIENLIVAEAHVRDLVARAPLEMSDEERLGFAGLRKFLEWEDNPLIQMGINAVELQPLTEYDGNPKDYHWGYMPLNYFAPASGYASDPAKLSQLNEMAEVVELFHRRGLAVIVDVVFNHFGEPPCVLRIDKAYYLRINAEGGLTNWSGCGNDTRAESAMSQRLMLEALEHWVKAFGVDGFRFDLAELLGTPFLRQVEARLRKLKPDIILIAEPWSFRGHIAAQLKPTQWSSWNDGFREFVPAYLGGRSNAQAAKYFVGGSVGGVARQPWQSVNYVESHDDRTWIDRITENADKNGNVPTLHDRRQSHLMMTLLTMSLGVPLWSAGMEMLRSKMGVNNTYQRPDLNALDYERQMSFPATVAYARALNRLRLGPLGRALRVPEITPDYLRFFEVPNSAAIGVLYNALRSSNARRVMYFINPSSTHVKFSLEGLRAEDWLQIADFERVEEHGLGFGKFDWRHNELDLSPHSAGIFVEKSV